MEGWTALKSPLCDFPWCWMVSHIPCPWLVDMKGKVPMLLAKSVKRGCFLCMWSGWDDTVFGSVLMLPKSLSPNNGCIFFGGRWWGRRCGIYFSLLMFRIIYVQFYVCLHNTYNVFLFQIQITEYFPFVKRYWLTLVVNVHYSNEHGSLHCIRVYAICVLPSCTWEVAELAEGDSTGKIMENERNLVLTTLTKLQINLTEVYWLVGPVVEGLPTNLVLQLCHPQMNT